MDLIVTLYQICKEKVKKKMGFEQTMELKYAKKNDGFDSNSVSDLIGEKEKNMGF